MNISKVSVTCVVCQKGFKVSLMLASAGLTCRSCEKKQEFNGERDENWPEERPLDNGWYNGIRESDIEDILRGM